MKNTTQMKINKVKKIKAKVKKIFQVIQVKIKNKVQNR